MDGRQGSIHLCYADVTALRHSIAARMQGLMKRRRRGRREVLEVWSDAYLEWEV